MENDRQTREVNGITIRLHCSNIIIIGNTNNNIICSCAMRGFAETKDKYMKGAGAGGIQ